MVSFLLIHQIFHKHITCIVKNFKYTINKETHIIGTWLGGLLEAQIISFLAVRPESAAATAVGEGEDDCCPVRERDVHGHI